MVLLSILLCGCVGTYQDTGEKFMLAAGPLTSAAELNSKASAMCYSRGYSHWRLLNSQGQDMSNKRFFYECLQQPTTPPANQQQDQQPLAPSIDDAKKKCIDLGFKSGTDSFGNCVLRLTK